MLVQGRIGLNAGSRSERKLGNQQHHPATLYAYSPTMMSLQKQSSVTASSQAINLNHLNERSLKQE